MTWCCMPVLASGIDLHRQCPCAIRPRPRLRLACACPTLVVVTLGSGRTSLIPRDSVKFACAQSALRCVRTPLRRSPEGVPRFSLLYTEQRHEVLIRVRRNRCSPERVLRTAYSRTEQRHKGLFALRFRRVKCWVDAPNRGTECLFAWRFPSGLAARRGPLRRRRFVEL